MKGEVLNYDDNAGTGQISGADGIRYSFTRADLKQLVPIGRGTRVDFDFEGKAAKDIYIDGPAAAMSSGPAPKPGTMPYTGTIEPDLGLWGYFIRAYTAKFASFSGRARRKEYWAVVLFNLIIYVILYGVIIGGAVALGSEGNFSTSDPSTFFAIMARSPLILIFGGLAILWSLISILPGLGLLARRLHDIGQSGWWIIAIVIVGLIPRVGAIGSLVVLVIALIKGQPGENKYGPPVA
jgi:uncharacterized membrane protein YhaH (DUF805 family)